MSQQEKFIKHLQEQLDASSTNWQARKDLASLFYETGRAEEATDLLWSAPEIPSTDVDIAFVVKIVAGCKPNRAIRLMFDLLEKNSEKPAKNIAIAHALNAEGMYMLAARFYGAALAKDASLFDLAFEKQSLWMDDSKQIYDAWREAHAGEGEPLENEYEQENGQGVDPSQLLQLRGLETQGQQAGSQLMRTMNPTVRKPPLKQPDKPQSVSPAVPSQAGGSAPRPKLCAAPPTASMIPQPVKMRPPEDVLAQTAQLQQELAAAVQTRESEGVKQEVADSPTPKLKRPEVEARPKLNLPTSADSKKQG